MGLFTSKQKTNNAAPNDQAGKPLVEIRALTKAYETPAGSFPALKGLDLTLSQGEFVMMNGKSGAGKSTLINMMTGIDRPTSGEVFVSNKAIHKLTEEQIAVWRGQSVGVIFQFFQLMPSLTCVENVMLPMDFGNLYKNQRERYQRAMHLLEQMEIADHALKKPSAVSGGQRQRVAIARALANDPPFLAADEPTGNLDSKTADAVFRLFEELVSQGKTIFMATHDRELASRVPRQIMLVDGEIVDDSKG